MTNTVWFEVIGLALVLAGTFIKLFLTDLATEGHKEKLHYDMALNVNRTLNVLIDHYRREHHAGTDAGKLKAFNLDFYQQGLENVELVVPLTAQAERFRAVDTFLFLVGSALLILAKLAPLLAPQYFRAQ